jgi:hypothetical protein
MTAQGRAARDLSLAQARRDERGCSPLMVRHFDDKFLANKGIDF